MNVSIGPSSIVGWLTFIGGEITFAGTAIGGNEATLHGPGKWAAIGGLIALVSTNAMRQLQAAAAAHAPPAASLLPTDAEELASPPPDSEPAEAAPAAPAPQG